jgi:hypothetical protein
MEKLLTSYISQLLTYDNRMLSASSENECESENGDAHDAHLLHNTVSHRWQQKVLHNQVNSVRVKVKDDGKAAHL